MYGSNFWSWTRSPRETRSRPSEAAVIPLPSDETTPPVTKMNFVVVRFVVVVALMSALQGRSDGADPRAGSRDPTVSARAACPSPRLRSPRDSRKTPGRSPLPAPPRSVAQRREEVAAAEHPLELVAPVGRIERLDAGVGRVA